MSGQSPHPSVGAEIASLFPLTEIQDRTGASDLVYVKKDTSLLESSAETMRDIGKIMRTYGEFEADTPTLWPLKGVHGVITTRFGWTINPFTNLGYLHQGVDIAWGVGTPIVAAANGAGGADRLQRGAWQLRHHPAQVRIRDSIPAHAACRDPRRGPRQSRGRYRLPRVHRGAQRGPICTTRFTWEATTWIP